MFKEKIRINFYDCDPAGILFYANLFKYAHKAYEKMIDGFNADEGYFDSRKFVVPIIHAEGDYIKPMKPGNEIIIETVVSQMRNSSFELTYTFTDSGPNICAKVKTVHVFVDKESFEKIDIPEHIAGELETNKV